MKNLLFTFVSSIVFLACTSGTKHSDYKMHVSKKKEMHFLSEQAIKITGDNLSTKEKRFKKSRKEELRLQANRLEAEEKTQKTKSKNKSNKHDGSINFY